jgi:hypothetical protein
MERVSNLAANCALGGVWSRTLFFVLMTTLSGLGGGSSLMVERVDLVGDLRIDEDAIGGDIIGKNGIEIENNTYRVEDETGSLRW